MDRDGIVGFDAANIVGTFKMFFEQWFHIWNNSVGDIIGKSMVDI